MKKSALFAVLVSTLAVTPSAADAAGSWSGFYVGIESGIARNIVTDHDQWPAVWDQEQTSTGFLAGAFAGYDQQFGDFVIGGVADIDYVGTQDLVFSGKSDANYDMNMVATARVRAGWAANDQFMLYGTGGVALAGVSGQLPGMITSIPIKSTEIGYVVGLGAEYRFRPNWSVRGEYLHYDFGTISDPLSPAEFKPRLDAFKIGLAYRF